MNMRRFTFLLIITLAATTTLADKKESLESLKQRAEQASEAQQVDLLMKVAELQLQVADEAYTAGNSDQAQQALKDVVSYGVRAGQAAATTGKKMKHTEISLRKISARLEELRRSVNVDDRPPLVAAVDSLEKVRTELLTRMFRK